MAIEDLPLVDVVLIIPLSVVALLPPLAKLQIQLELRNLFDFLLNTYCPKSTYRLFQICILAFRLDNSSLQSCQRHVSSIPDPVATLTN